MIESLWSADRTLFTFINQTLANGFFDAVMPVLTNDWFLRLAYAAIIIALLVRKKGQVAWVVLFSMAVLAVTDAGSSAVLKPWFARPRPCHILDVHLLVRCGAGFSFPSSHAANLFGQALFFGLLYPRGRWYYIAIASLVGLSRISVGVHYPADILGGAALGGLIGAVAAAIILRGHKKNMIKPRQYILADGNASGPDSR